MNEILFCLVILLQDLFDSGKSNVGVQMSRKMVCNPKNRPVILFLVHRRNQALSSLITVRNETNYDDNQGRID